MKRIRVVFIVASILGGVIFILNMISLNYKGAKEFINYNYAGNIEEIEFTVQGFARVKVDTGWYYLGHNIDIAKYVNIGDSIAKRKGESKITVYKKNNTSYKTGRTF